MSNWNKKFIGLASEIASWSKDPSSKVGAVITRPNNTIVSLGYNGFPRGVNDDPSRYNDRETKLKYVCHAEANAIINGREDLTGYTIFSYPLHPCCDCAKLIINSGIKKVVTTKPVGINRYKESFEAASNMFKEAEIEVEYID